MAGMSAAATTLLQAVVLAPVAERTERERLGFLFALDLPAPMRRIAGVLLLDYTLWWWHWLNHRLPPLWRFHLVHHVDRDLDGSTGIRFHFGEMAMSVFFRAAQVRLLGVDRLSASIWQTLLLISIVFHHSNLRLAESTDRLLARWIVTPRMHGIHHSSYRDETDSNWSSLFSFWDAIHGTLRLDPPQDAIEIGVPAYQSPEDVTLSRIAALPFVEQRDDWLDSEGTRRMTRATDDRALAAAAGPGDRR